MNFVFIKIASGIEESRRGQFSPENLVVSACIGTMMHFLVHDEEKDITSECNSLL